MAAKWTEAEEGKKSIATSQSGCKPTDYTWAAVAIVFGDATT